MFFLAKLRLAIIIRYAKQDLLRTTSPPRLLRNHPCDSLTSCGSLAHRHPWRQSSMRGFRASPHPPLITYHKSHNALLLPQATIVAILQIASAIVPQRLCFALPRLALLFCPLFTLLLSLLSLISYILYLISQILVFYLISCFTQSLILRVSELKLAPISVIFFPELR